MRTTTHTARALLLAAPFALAACSGESDSATNAPASNNASTPEASDETTPDAAEPDTASLDAFADRIATAFADGDSQTLISSMKPVNVPEGWQGMLAPMLTSMKGKEVTAAVQPRADFSNEDLMWPDPTPAALAEVEHILVVGYEEETESAKLTFALTQDNGDWKILLAQ